MKNLDAYHLPNSDSRHLIMKEGISSKEARRNEIERLYQVVLYIGDNLADFNAAFDKRSTDERADMVSKFSLDFGDKYIVLPNPVYGDWESALYNNIGGLGAAQKDSLLRTIGKWY